jgi:hypothetical protein
LAKLLQLPVASPEDGLASTDGLVKWIFNKLVDQSA